jgi:hypothetical protein
MAAQNLQSNHAQAIIKMEEQKTDEIHPKETKVVKNAHPKETKVVKNAPPKHDIMDDPDDITQQLLAET